MRGYDRCNCLGPCSCGVTGLRKFVKRVGRKVKRAVKSVGQRVERTGKSVVGRVERTGQSVIGRAERTVQSVYERQKDWVNWRNIARGAGYVGAGAVAIGGAIVAGPQVAGALGSLGVTTGSLAGAVGGIGSQALPFLQSVTPLGQLAFQYQMMRSQPSEIPLPEIDDMFPQLFSGSPAQPTVPVFTPPAPAPPVAGNMLPLLLIGGAVLLIGSRRK